MPGTTRRYATKLQKEAIELLKDFDPSTKLTNLKSVKEAILERLDCIKDLDNQTIMHINDDEIDHEVTEAATLRDGVKETLAEIYFVLTEERDGSSSRSSHNGSRYSQTKLQPINMKEFTGNPKEWQQFWDAFCSTVYENETFPRSTSFTT